MKTCAFALATKSMLKTNREIYRIHTLYLRQSLIINMPGICSMTGMECGFQTRIEDGGIVVMCVMLNDGAEKMLIHKNGTISKNK